MNAAKIEEGLRMLEASERLATRARAMIAEGAGDAAVAEPPAPQDEVSKARARKLLRDRGIRLRGDRVVR